MDAALARGAGGAAGEALAVRFLSVRSLGAD